MLRNRSQSSWLLLLGLLSLLSLGRPAVAGPNAPAPTATAPAHPVIPDYGGRNGSLGSALDGSGAPAPLNPLAQAGRALEALVIVLVVVAGGLVLLKRSGLLKSDGTFTVKGGPAFWSSLVPKLSARGPAASAGPDGASELLMVLGSQALPNSPGACLHLVSVGGRVLLLGATGQAVTMLTEVAEFAPPVEDARGVETPEDAAAFADYLARVGVTPPTANGADVTHATLSAATDRLQSLVNRRTK